MPREGIKIAAEFLHIDGDVRDRLRAVEQDGDAAIVSQFHQLLRWIDGAEHVRDVDQGDDLRARAKAVLELLDDEFALVGHRCDDQFGTSLLGDELPGDDVGVVLHLRYQDLVAGSEIACPVAAGDEIDPLRRPAHEQNFVHVLRVDKAGDRLARTVVGVACLHAQIVDAAMDIGVLASKKCR